MVTFFSVKSIDVKSKLPRCHPNLDWCFSKTINDSKTRHPKQDLHYRLTNTNHCTNTFAVLCQFKISISDWASQNFFLHKALLIKSCGGVCLWKNRICSDQQSCSILNNIVVTSSKFINKFEQKCQSYNFSDQSIPLVTVTLVVSLLTEQLCLSILWHLQSLNLLHFFITSWLAVSLDW